MSKEINSKTTQPQNQFGPEALPGGETSRRKFVAAAVTFAAAAGTSEAAQAPRNLRFDNPPGLSRPNGYSQLAEVLGSGRTLFIAGQTATDAAGKVADGFRAQAVQVYENLKVALAAAGAGFEHVVKVNTYLTDIPAQIATLREVRAMYLNAAAPPASTTVQIVALADPRFLIEVEAIAVLPPQG
jgi:enamine deaminase RidA (YjgF/YER057c/UK114 family)